MNKLNRSITGIIVLLMLSGMYLSSCGSQPAYVPPAASGGGSTAVLPVWYTSAGAAQYADKYVIGRGEGSTAEEAQYKAKGDLLQVFGVKLADESVISENFQSTTRNNNTNWTETVASNRRISASAEGILVGCEIKESEVVGRTHYALAVMEKAKAVSSYNDIIARLTSTIREVLNVQNMNTIDGYARNLIAAEFAKDIESCISVLRFVGGTATIPAGLKSERDYLTDARNILTSIPVRVVVVSGNDKDRENRVQNAFAQAIGNVGFRTGTASSPYVLEVTLAFSQENFPGNANVFSRYEISANFLDASNRQSVIPVYSINQREGHTTYDLAEGVALRAAERRINTEYKDIVEKSLAQFY